MEALYWMIGEGIQEAIVPSDLRVFLDAPLDVLERVFADLEDRKHVRETARGYVFADIQGFDASHMDYWCHDPDHAEDEWPSEHDHH